MKTLVGFFILVTMLSVQGCSKESVKRAAYGSAQIYGQQQCAQEVSADCPEPESYEEYQRKRKESPED